MLGILVGSVFPGIPTILSKWEYAHVSVPVAILIWFMIYPMMVQIDFGSIVRVGKKPKGLIVTLVVNWVIKPFTIIGLLLTLIILFSFQGEIILRNPIHILLIAIPLTIQTYLIFAIGYLWCRWWRVDRTVAAPAAMIGASNFFELAVAVAISLFGLNSGAALATVVGVLEEVPIMLSLVTIANRTRHWFPAPRTTPEEVR